MKKTLYDVLGVRRDAPRGEIERAYERMLAVYGGATGAEAQVRDGCSIALLEEAFATLSNSARREIYDASLQRMARLALEVRHASMVEEPKPVAKRIKWALLGMVVVAWAGWYWKSGHDAQVERERQAEFRRLEQERMVIEAEAERLRTENERMAMRAASEEERAMREAQVQNARLALQRSYAEHAEFRQQENERRQAERERQTRERDERMARERADRQAREREMRLAYERQRQEAMERAQEYEQRRALEREVYMQQQREAQERRLREQRTQGTMVPVPRPGN